MPVGEWVQPDPRPLASGWTGEHRFWAAGTVRWLDTLVDNRGDPGGSGVAGVLDGTVSPGLIDHYILSGSHVGSALGSSHPADYDPGWLASQSVLTVTPTPDYPLIGPDVVPPGATVEYEGAGQYPDGFELALAWNLSAFAEPDDSPTRGTVVEGHAMLVSSPPAAYPSRAVIAGWSTHDTATTTVTRAPFPGETGVGTDVVSTFAVSASGISVALVAEPQAGGWVPPAPPKGISGAGGRPAGRFGISAGNNTSPAMTLTGMYVPPRYRLITASGQWRTRQRQSLTGSDSWPTRQRQSGHHSGSWATRQRQSGV